MIRGEATDLADGTVMLKQTWADDEGVAVGDDVTLEMPTGRKTYRVVGTYDDNPLVFFPILTTNDTLERRGLPAVRQRGDRDGRAGSDRAPGRGSSRWSRTCRS